MHGIKNKNKEKTKNKQGTVAQKKRVHAIVREGSPGGRSETAGEGR